MTRISRRVLFIYLSLAVLVSATPTSLSAAPPNVDPCTLLTIAEVEQTVGALATKRAMPPGATTSLPMARMHWRCGCFHPGPSGGAGPSLRIPSR